MEVQYSSQGVPRKRRSHCRKIGNSNAQKLGIDALISDKRDTDEIGSNDNAEIHADTYIYDDNVYVDYFGLEKLGLGCIPAQEVVMLTRTLRFDAFLRKTRDCLEVCIAHLERAF